MRRRSRFLVATTAQVFPSIAALLLAGALGTSCSGSEEDDGASSSGSGGSAGPGSGGSDGGGPSSGPSSATGTGASGATGGESSGEGGAGAGGAGGATASSSSSAGGAPCVDNDGDGWTQCDGDCCDAAGLDCSAPEKVNPGAYEALGNLVDDDCDPSTNDTTPLTCSVATLSPPTSADDLTRAMDLCQFTTLNPPLPDKKWGVISAELVLASGNGSPDDIQRGVLANYGTAVSPMFGANMAALSSGTARDKTDPGWEDPQNPNSLIGYSPGWNEGSPGNPPADYLAAHGGSLPAAAGCPNGVGANDSANLKLSIRVPTNAQSFSYQFKFYTSEYPEWVCDEYNDFFLALLTSTASGIPADENISFDANGNPVSVNNAFFQVCSPQGNNPCPDGVAELAGTGMATSAGKDGGGTSWLTTDAPITPGETIELRFIVWDTGDHWYDSLALLDNFQWKLDPSAVGTHE